jgi:hypothetical protein
MMILEGLITSQKLEITWLFQARTPVQMGYSIYLQYPESNISEHFFSAWDFFPANPLAEVRPRAAHLPSVDWREVATSNLKFRALLLRSV